MRTALLLTTPFALAAAALGARTADAETAGAARSRGWTGSYAGRFDGAARGSLEIERGASGRLRIGLAIAKRGCAGSVTVTAAAPRGNILVGTSPRDEHAGQCRLTLRRRGDRIRVREEGCIHYHGFSCSFDGEVERR